MFALSSEADGFLFCSVCVMVSLRWMTLNQVWSQLSAVLSEWFESSLSLFESRASLTLSLFVSVLCATRQCATRLLRCPKTHFLVRLQ